MLQITNFIFPEQKINCWFKQCFQDLRLVSIASYSLVGNARSNHQVCKAGCKKIIQVSNHRNKVVHNLPYQIQYTRNRRYQLEVCTLNHRISIVLVLPAFRDMNPQDN